jgi:hypothetical protein
MLGFMGRTLRFLALGLSLCLATLSTTAAGLPTPDSPLPVDSYHDQEIPALIGKLTGRIRREPLNLVATIIFLGAIVHTFLVAFHGWSTMVDYVGNVNVADPGRHHRGESARRVGTRLLDERGKMIQGTYKKTFRLSLATPESI